MEACSRTDFGKCWPRHRRGPIDSAVAFTCLLGLLAAGGVAAQRGVPDPNPDTTTTAADVAPARARLEAFNAEVRSLTARFTQATWTVDDQLVDEAAGSFALLRPGRFVWHTEMPFEHVVVADGDALWMYDVELEQATRTRIADVSGANPGSLLAGEGDVDDDYRVVSTYRLDDREFIELVPRDPRAEYSRIIVAFRGAAPVSIEIVDGLNQTTSIEFTDIEINPDIAAERFEFEPPQGVNVIGEER